MLGAMEKISKPMQMFRPKVFLSFFKNNDKAQLIKIDKTSPQRLDPNCESPMSPRNYR